MRFDLHHHFDDRFVAEIIREIRQMSAQLDALTAQVAQTKTIAASAIALIQGLAAQIEANKTDPAALQALADSLRETDATLADAVAANTPAAPPASPPAA